MNIKKINQKFILYLIKQIILLVLALFIISLLTFSLIKLTPGDPAINYLKASHIPVNSETLKNARIKLDLDKPLILQYTNWLSEILKGNFGKSYIQNELVIKIIERAVNPTIVLGLFSFLLLFLISFFLGIISALKHNKVCDYLIQTLAYFSVSIPQFWLAYLLIIIFSIKLKILPVSGQDEFKNLILPAFTLITPLIGQTTLLIRKTLILEMQSPHVQNAITRGVSQYYIVINHLLLNSSITIITVFSSNILYLCTGSILIEEIFAWPGLGKMFITAVQFGDLPLIQISLLFFGIFAIIINTLNQMFVHFLDPHLKTNRKRLFL